MDLRSRGENREGLDSVLNKTIKVNNLDFDVKEEKPSFPVNVAV